MADDAPNVQDNLAQQQPFTDLQNNLAQAAANQAPTPPKLGSPAFMPGGNLVELIKGLVTGGRATPTTNPNTGAPQINQPQSRLDTFEHFLGNFTMSLAQGLAASGHGPGANERGAAAAMMAPQQRALQQYGLQQQQFNTQQEANLRQQQIAASQAQTQETQARTAAIPQQLALQQQQVQFEQQTKLATLQLENQWRQAMIAINKQNANTKESAVDYRKEVDNRKLDLQSALGSGRLALQKLATEYRGADTQSQITTRAAMVEIGQDKLAQAAVALQQANTLKTSQAVENYQKAYNDVGFLAGLERQLDMAPSIQQMLSSYPNPVTLPGMGGGAAAPSGFPRANAPTQSRVPPAGKSKSSALDPISIR